MSQRARLLTKDEELGKRDDDFRPPPSTSPSFSDLLPWKWRRIYVLTTIAVVALVYVVTSLIPPDAFTIPMRQVGNYTPPRNPYVAVAPQQPSEAPPRDTGADVEDSKAGQYYNGPISYFKLAPSLHKVANTMGKMPQNRNVLFAASSLKSLANLLPMACAMTTIDRNYVHIAVFGRSALSIEEILQINGVDGTTCRAFFHDARSDFAEYSSDARAEAATRGAMVHINNFVHPQAMLMDDSTKEDAFFTRAMRVAAKAIGKPLIEIPAGHYEQWLWITRLDAGSLGSWFEPNIEIVIHAQPGTSGSVIRLLKSLSDAEYKGLKIPKLTIELPTDVEMQLHNYFYWFQWPPGKEPSQPSLLNLRHRISSSRVSSEQASLRFVESFYPSNTQHYHVLVLSPQAEVSPLYLQYLYYNILEYRYMAWGSPGSENVAGISLDIPASFLDGKGGFRPPTLANVSDWKNEYEKYEQASDSPPFMYQAVSSAATLVFGDKWASFHDFLTKRIEASHSGKQGKTEKTVSEAEPAWVEFLVELMRSRGWSVLHPPSPMVTIHNDLVQIPEEYSRPPPGDSKATEVFRQFDNPEEEPFVLSPNPPIPVEHTEVDLSKIQKGLHQMLPFNGELQEVGKLPHLSHEGQIVDPWLLQTHKDEYATFFRGSIGGCQGADAARRRISQDPRTDDLFCLPGIDSHFADEDQPEEGDSAAQVAQAIADSTVAEVRGDGSVAP